MSVGNENIAIRGSHDIGRLIESVFTRAGDPRLAEGQQHFAFGAELDGRVALAVLALRVGHPHIAIAVDVDAVRKHEHAGAETLQIIAGLIELDDRRHIRAGAGAAAAALEHPHAPAIRIDIHRPRGAPLSAVGEFRPAVFAIRIRRIRRVRGVCQ